MKKFVTGMLILALSELAMAWGAPDILPVGERAKSYDLETKLDKKKSFQKILVWSARTFANSNESIKMKDSEMGMLIAKGNLPCKALKIGNGYADNQRVEFTLEMIVDDKKTEVKVSEVVGRAEGAYDDGARPSQKAEMEAALKECIDPFIDLIKKELQ